jgi:hypothetical protein
MFGIFGKKRKEEKSAPRLADLDQNPLKEGDLVLSLRYDLGKCRIIKSGDDIQYESIETGKRVSWALMIDAATELQKVKKLEDQ